MKNTFCVALAAAFTFLKADVALAEQKQGSFALKEKTVQEEVNSPRNMRMDDYLEIFRGVSDRYQIPLPVMLALAEGESRFSPWALNVEGKSYYPKSKGEALQIISTCQGKSFDIGLMQINSYWLRRFGLRAEDVLEPAVNVLLAGYIINENFIAYGPTWKAIGAYNTPPHKNPGIAMAYTRKFADRFKRFMAELEKEKLKRVQ